MSLPVQARIGAGLVIFEKLWINTPLHVGTSKQRLHKEHEQCIEAYDGSSRNQIKVFNENR